MKQLLILLFSCFASMYAAAQKDCDLSLMPKESKEQLAIFWETLKKAVQEQDSNKIISLCDFPFSVSTAIATNKESDRGEFFQLDSTNIIQYASLIFYDEHFKEALSLCADASKCLISHGSFKTKHKTCSYLFCYQFKKEGSSNEVRCFSITKIDGLYKLTGVFIRQ